ncbi:MAG: BMP family ABC transporter substrate-binding protein [Aristaeellaceae bacterium]
MSRADALLQYNYALKQGLKYYNSCVIRGTYPYPQVLDEVFTEDMCAGKTQIGLVDIPMDQIVGTTTAGRKTAFAGNFMPLLDPETEFGSKWINLCYAHLGTVGITDPIICNEYMGRFYVTEGNKRVSVMKSYDAATIPGIVTRLIPAYSDDIEVQIYYEFMDFYQLSRLYEISFRRLGGFPRLQGALNFAPGHKWTEEERRDVQSAYRALRTVFDKLNTEQLPLAAGDALLAWLEIYPLSELETCSAAEITQRLNAMWPDLRVLAKGTPITVSTAPQEAAEKKSLLQTLGIAKPPRLNVAFVHAFDPQKSTWSAAHELGRQQLEQAMGERISVTTQVCSPAEAPEVMDKLVQDGAQVIFTTTPPLMDACRKVAAKHPGVRMLNCSLSMPYTGVRTYYSRMHEGKFITGAIAGAMAKEGRIGYIANYPIVGTMACINAFALGARMTNPNARIDLRWSCLPGDHVADFLGDGVSVISNRDNASGETHFAWEWGTYQVLDNGELTPLASPVWNWGKLYEQIILSIFNGSWDAVGKGSEQAVNYWWGMNSGVIDVLLSDTLPAGVRQLGDILKEGLSKGVIAPFHGEIRDQQGQVRNDGTAWLTPEEIMNMDWLCENVDGSIPAYEELLPASRPLVRQLGIYRDQLPMEAEGTP